MEKKLNSAKRFGIIALTILTATAAFADDPPPTPEDLERLAAIEAFTKKQIAANYGEKFKQAADEFKVPVEILMGVSFAETRHEHLTWPEGEKYSPENGMPRPYGIMSLWDNDIFGHSLVEGAKLIGKTPEEVMRDPLQNMRAGAALLRQYYDSSDKPAYAKENSLESWKYAIVKYSGIPEPDLSHSHAWDVYDFLSQGYDQYGIKLPEVPDLDLKEMWEETKRIKEEQRKINEEKWRAQGLMDDVILEEVQNPDGTYTARPAGEKPAEGAKTEKLPQGEREKVQSPGPVVATTNTSAQGNSALWIGIVLASIGVLGLLIFRKKPAAAKK